MTSLRSLFTLYPFDILFKPKYGFESWLSFFNGADQNFYIQKVSGTTDPKMGVEPLKQRDKENKQFSLSLPKRLLSLALVSPAELLNQGVNFYSEAPRYYYTQLADLKIEMISKATEDARIRAEKIAAYSN